MSKKALKAAGFLAGTAAVAGAAAFTVTKILVDTALDRDMPRVMKNSDNLISGSGTDPEKIESALKKGDELEAMPHEDVEITAADGIKLKGHWYHKEGDKRVVIAMHGWRSSWKKDFGTCAEFFLENDCSVLFAEQRGQNSSGGDSMGFGLVERFDCLSWIDFVRKATSGTLPIYLAGVSMGAATVLMTAGFDLPKEVHGIIADCGFTSPYEIWRHVTERNLHLPFGLKGKMANLICKMKIDMSADEYSTLDAMKNATVPILFIHGMDDHFVPVDMTFKNYAACKSQKRLFLVPGADHAMSYVTDRAGYERVVKNFFEDFDN